MKNETEILRALVGLKDDEDWREWLSHVIAEELTPADILEHPALEEAIEAIEEEAIEDIPISSAETILDVVMGGPLSDTSKEWNRFELLTALNAAGAG